MNNNLNEKISQIHSKNHTEENSSNLIPPEELNEKYESAELFSTEKNDKFMISKKKAISFEGAQYRRVRKLA